MCIRDRFNSNRFDIPVLAEEFLRAGVDIDLSRRKFVDVQVIFHKLEQRTLSAAYKFYCGKNLEDAHTAAADTQATYEVLMAQLDRYSELQNDVAFLADYSSFNKNVDFAGRMICLLYTSPVDKLSNINDGQKNSDYSNTKILKVNGIGNGYTNIFYFRRHRGEWELYKYEDTSI